jgi:hypothetical protein
MVVLRDTLTKGERSLVSDDLTADRERHPHARARCCVAELEAFSGELRSHQPNDLRQRALTGARQPPRVWKSPRHANGSVDPRRSEAV